METKYEFTIEPEQSGGVKLTTQFVDDEIIVRCGARGEEVAQLIAAAPELLDFAEMCLPALQQVAATDPCNHAAKILARRACAAIAKATGATVPA